MKSSENSYKADGTGSALSLPVMPPLYLALTSGNVKPLWVQCRRLSLKKVITIPFWGKCGLVELKQRYANMPCPIEAGRC